MGRAHLGDGQAVTLGAGGEGHLLNFRGSRYGVRVREFFRRRFERSRSRNSVFRGGRLGLRLALVVDRHGTLINRI